MCEQRDTPVPRKHHADYSDRDHWGTTKNIHRVVCAFKWWPIECEAGITVICSGYNDLKWVKKLRELLCIVS